MREETKERIEKHLKERKKQQAQIAKGVIIVVLILITILVARAIIIKINYPQKYSEYVEKYAKENNIEKELIYAMIKAESHFKEEAISNKEAIGLMQILESTAQEVAEELEIEVTKEEIIKPETNIALGTKYLSKLIEKYGDTKLAIAAYNAGIGNVDSWIEKEIIKKDGSNIENIPFKETNNYVRKILRDYEIYKKICK